GPLYVGGHAEGALRRAGELGDGWIMSPFGAVRDFPRLWRAVRDAAHAAGRNSDALVAGRLLYVAVDDDRNRAGDALRGFLHGYYGARFDVDQHAIFGPPREVAERLIEHVEAGITKLMLGVPSVDLAHLRRLATAHAPSFSLILRSQTRKVLDPAFREEVERALAPLRRDPRVARVRTAYDPPGPVPAAVPLVSRDGRSTLVTVELRGTAAGFASLE